MNFTKTQEQIITTDKSKVLVASAAASGKSAVIVERLRYLLDKGVDPFKIVAITFTNNAASVMYERLGKPEGLFIGTIHSYCNYLLRGGAIDTTNIIVEERFNDLFEEIKLNPDCLRHVEHLLVDECQDSTRQQFEFFELINPDNFMYCGDIRQSIYGFNGADPDYIAKLSHNPEITVYHMNQNFRNLPDILRFAKKFLYRLGPDYDDESISMREDTTSLKYHVMDYNATIGEAASGLVILKNKLNSDWKDWFVLCRSNSDVDKFIETFAEMEIPTDTFKQASLTNAQIRDKMEDNTIKVLTVHSAKGLEAPYVLTYNVRAYNDEEARLCYVAATRAKDFLIWARAPKKRKTKTTTVNWE